MEWYLINIITLVLYALAMAGVIGVFKLAQWIHEGFRAEHPGRKTFEDRRRIVIGRVFGRIEA